MKNTLNHSLTRIDHVTMSQQEKMSNMVRKYSSGFGRHQGSLLPTDQRKHVLLTGSTGGLGSFILNSLVMDKDVAHVYCINRRGKVSSINLSERQSSALLDKGLDAGIIRSPKLHLLQGCFDEENWGLGSSIYCEMLRNVTHIIHNAWPLNFKMSLESFEPNVRTVRSLIDFSLSSMLAAPPVLLFASTMGIFLGVDPLALELPETPVEANTAVGYGYTESKWVAEQVLLAASEQTTLMPMIVRIGQLCSGPNGSFNVKEWFPALIQAAKLVSCLPARSGTVSWLPMDVAARSIVDFIRYDPPTIIHLVHPKPVAWSRLAARFSYVLDIPIVPVDEFIVKIENMVAMMQSGTKAGHAQTGKVMAALPLLRLFREKSALNPEENQLMDAFGIPFATSMRRGLSLSQSLAQAPPVGESAVDAWINYWKQVGFI